MLKDLGIIAGIKVDRGFNTMMGMGKETHTQVDISFEPHLSNPGC